MQEFAKSKGMEVIPLVQTFGHMEVKLTLCFLASPECPFLKNKIFIITYCFYFSLS